MAKKSISIDEVNSLLKTSNSFGDIISKSDYTKTLEFIHTGNYHLNACFSGSLLGGLPSNKSICLSGDSGAGKTFLALNIVKELQNKDYNIIYYDTEGAVDIDSIKSFDIDPNKFNHQPLSDLNKFRTSIVTLTKKLIEIKESGGTTPKIAVILDSLGMLATQKEIDDAISGNLAADMTRAKMIRSLFRIITADLSGLGIPFLYTNHTYACLVGEYDIQTIDGLKNIKDIQIGDLVNTLDGYKPIENVFSYEDVDVIEIELENGKILKCTPNHKFLTGDNWEDDSCWTRADELTSESIIYKI